MLRHYEGGPRTPNSPILFTKGCSGFLRWLRRSLPVLRVAGCEPGPLVPRPREGSLHYLTRGYGIIQTIRQKQSAAVD
jgi:hypothetical protein